MANEQELIEALRRQAKSQDKLTAAIAALTDALATQAAAVHALADSLAACTTEDAHGEPEAALEPAVAVYADGSPVGRG